MDQSTTYLVSSGEVLQLFRILDTISQFLIEFGNSPESSILPCHKFVIALLTACLHYSWIRSSSNYFESVRSEERIYTSGAGSTPVRFVGVRLR